MRSFKLILYFLLLSNGYSDYSVQNCDNCEDSNDEVQIAHNLASFVDASLNATSEYSLKKKRNFNPLKFLGFGSFDQSNGGFDSFLVKNDSGNISESNGLAYIDDELKKWLHFSKSSENDDCSFA